MIPKFRAWHHEWKIMLEVDAIYLVTEELRVWDRTAKIKTGDGDNCRRRIHFDEIKLMQSTGLKDKNGKEIFEGDIVNYGEEFNDVVVFEKGTFCLKDNSGHLTWLGQEFEEIELEVIGNIYEHPELLKEVRT